MLHSSACNCALDLQRGKDSVGVKGTDASRTLANDFERRVASFFRTEGMGKSENEREGGC